MQLVQPDWDAPTNIRAFTTTRIGDPEKRSFAFFHSGHDHEIILANRKIFCEQTGLPQEPLWLSQVHGNHIIEWNSGDTSFYPQADGAVTSMTGIPLVILTADCLPILACDQKGKRIGAFHAGWKGLAAGIIKKAVCAMNKPPHHLLFWIGPSISASAYQVRQDVYQAFKKMGKSVMEHFSPQGNQTWLFDLSSCAESLLRQSGVDSVCRSSLCTYSHPELFYSYRREHPCGRMASIIWINALQSDRL